MIRPSASWPPLPGAGFRSAAHQQRRFKAFVRRVDRNDQIYYTLAKRAPSQGPEPAALRDEFFEMPDLLLDLDAEGNRFVRPSDEADEERLVAKWDVVPKRIAVQARVKELEEQLAESRRRVKGLMLQSTSPWRLTSHDMLSVALRGASRGVKEAQAAEKSPGIIETLYVENGIPSHAAQDDHLVLEWMMLRRKWLEHSKKGLMEHAPSPEMLSKALKGQTSIAGIRRLVFQSLASGANDPTYVNQMDFGNVSKQPPNIPRKIRYTCLKVLGPYPENPTPRLETLTFIGNLMARLSKHNVSIGAALCGLALRLSAETGMPEATSEWLHRAYANNVWENGFQSSEDVLETLKTYIASLRDLQNGGFRSTHDRQLLFQLLTGLDENNSTTPDSFRALTMLFLQEEDAEHAFGIYESYITLLGQLGAVRTLWKEGQVSAPVVEELMKKRNAPGNVQVLFHAALMSSLRVAAPPPADGVPPTLGLDECVTLDYHSIDLQNPDAWAVVEGATSSSSSSREAAIGHNVGPALSLPLNEWLHKVGELVQRSNVTAA